MNRRLDPSRELDRIVNVAFDGGASASMPMDVVRSARDVKVHFDLPGVDADAVELTVERNRLTVKATRRYELVEGERLVVRERPSGDFVRTLALSDGLDSTKISAHYDRGVLTVTIPVADTAQPRRINVTSGADFVSDRALEPNTNAVSAN